MRSYLNTEAIFVLAGLCGRRYRLCAVLWGI